LAGALFRLRNSHAEVQSGNRSPARRGAPITLMVTLCALVAAAPSPPASADERASGAIARFQVVGDGIPQPLDGAQGNAERGRVLLVERTAANCLLCHAIADPRMRVAGNVAPSLDGVGRRLSVAQLRLRVADIQRVDPATIMPSYYRVEGLDRVTAEYRGKPILDARQVEDIVAYLGTMK
jgi:sulfur-oxidizing protein SoxX